MPHTRYTQQGALLGVLPWNKMCFIILGFWEVENTRLGNAFIQHHPSEVEPEVVTGGFGDQSSDLPPQPPRPKMDVKSPNMRCLQAPNPRAFSGESRVIFHIRNTVFPAESTAPVSVYTKSLPCSEDLGKVSFFSVFRLFCLWTWQHEPVTGLFRCMTEGARSPQALQ